MAGMIELEKLPFLHEAPPLKLEVMPTAARLHTRDTSPDHTHASSSCPAPPPRFSCKLPSCAPQVLTARDVMASPVVTLNKVARVKEIIGVVSKDHRDGHNGFPVTEAKGKDDISSTEIIHGLILRRQLLALLHARAWRFDAAKELEEAARATFLSSYVHQKELEAAVDGPFTEAELAAEIDLRPFIDAAPFMARNA